MPAGLLHGFDASVFTSRVIASVMLTLTLTLIALTTSQPTPETDRVVLVRSRMGPLSLVTPDTTARPLGPRSPTGFGAEHGRLRLIATSVPLHLAVVELAGPTSSTLFALSLPSSADPAPTDAIPVLLATARSVGLDVALSPDGTRLLYIDDLTPTVLDLAHAPTHPTAPPPPIRISTAPGTRRAAPPDLSIERPRWLDDHTIAFERAVSLSSGRIVTTLEAAPADGSAPARLLVPSADTQDRFAALVGDHLLAYRDGVLVRATRGARPVPLAPRFTAHLVAPFPNPLGRVDRAWLTFGPSGVTRELALATLDASGRPATLTPRRIAYLDPLVAPGHDHALWSVSTPRGFVVERVHADGTITPLTTPHPTPIELVAFTPDATRVVGCRGPDLVVVDLDRAAAAPAHHLTSAPDNPSCGVRALTPTHVAVDRKRADDQQTELHALDPRAASDPPQVLPRGAHVVAALGPHLITQSVAAPAATLIHEPRTDSAAHVTLLPWLDAGITDAHRSPDGRAVVFRVGGDTRWHAVFVARPGITVPISAPSDSAIALGLGTTRLVAWEPDAQRIVAYRLDGADRATPTIVLRDVLLPGPFAQDLERALALTRDGRLVSAPIDGSGADAPTVVVRGVAPWGPSQVLYDRARRRAVAVVNRDGLTLVVAAGILGEHADHPIAIGLPDPPRGAGLERLALTPDGDVLLLYATRTTAMPHPAGATVLAADGSGPRPRADPRSIPPGFTLWQAPALGLGPIRIEDDPYGRETRAAVD